MHPLVKNVNKYKYLWNNFFKTVSFSPFYIEIFTQLH